MIYESRRDRSYTITVFPKISLDRNISQQSQPPVSIFFFLSRSRHINLRRNSFGRSYIQFLIIIKSVEGGGWGVKNWWKKKVTKNILRRKQNVRPTQWTKKILRSMHVLRTYVIFVHTYDTCKTILKLFFFEFLTGEMSYYIHIAKYSYF